ncbi:hypothetical protein [Prauserella rugosa]|uniref:Uncharacterized protein n=1 Tax=Prauserella rugosa TaxID=43354 RepID=A0A660C8M8_9PSEU|nr:hypothetical protein [Prauserella rugosa]KMS92662.1 hypothetical protein ACZ91_03075 [Streptomyces regensis]TWH15999.1 hypothetical protein JD82_04987 [Prauserella rugosa]
MAGHRRTVPAPGARTTKPGVLRRNRTHLPAGETDQRERDRAISAGKSTAHARVQQRRGDLAGQIDAAREYLRSALGRYEPEQHVVDELVQHMIRTADQIIRTGTRRSAANKKRKGGGRAAA